MRAEGEIEARLELERLQDEADRDADLWNASVRARAHARMAQPANSYASPEICLVPAETVQDSGQSLWSKDAAPAPTPRYFASERWRGVASPNTSAASIFSEFISGPVVQAKCANCHVKDGISGHTRLVFLPGSEPDHESSNLAIFQEFLQSAEGGADTILAKIQGVAHGGGVQVPAGSAEFANMESFLRELGGVSGGGGIPIDELFSGVTMASPARTLRRAALVFAGRVPTVHELNAVSSGNLASLRRAIRQVMQGPGFHDFLLRGANDRLLTDRHLVNDPPLDQNTREFPDLVNEFWDRRHAAYGRGFDYFHHDPQYKVWATHLNWGVARAPLELVAHVVENDLPYTEILTADYIMANHPAAVGYGASSTFGEPADVQVFRPVRFESYYRNDDSKVVELRKNCCYRVINPGNLSTAYPHAGILNTNVFLRRYPSTATNRNRARSRWTYYHFLGVDIEKSASRTTDPEALSDTDNPTLKNPACAVCHSVMDPVAGAYQNYGDEGLYKENWGGVDSLAKLYKKPADGSVSLYHPGDTWYRDMRQPGFDGLLAPNTDNSVQWLAQQIAGDERFAEATVKFWWSPILGVDVVEPPEDRGDTDYEGRLLAANAQLAEVRRLATSFRLGIAGGKPYNLKDLLAEIALSPWFRAESLSGDDTLRRKALETAGMERLLTPEELVRKTESITGYSWGRHVRRHIEVNRLTTAYESYRLLYGGIDSDGITERARESTPLMAAVAQSHGIEVSCPIVMREFYITPDSERTLFSGVDTETTPSSVVSDTFEVTADSPERRQTLAMSAPLVRGSARLNLQFLNGRSFPDHNRNLYLDKLVVSDQGGREVYSVELESRPDIECGDAREEEFRLRDECEFNVPVTVPTEGLYRLEVVARQDAAGDEPARLRILDREFEVTAEQWEQRQTLSMEVQLRTGTQAVQLEFTNDLRIHASLYLGGLVVRSQSGEPVASVPFETVTENCGYVRRNTGENELKPWNDCTVPFNVPATSTYTIEVTARQRNAVGRPALLGLELESSEQGTPGELAIRTKIAELHQKLLGVDVALDSHDVKTAYELFLRIWTRKRDSGLRESFWDGVNCEFYQDNLFLDGTFEIDEHGNSHFSGDRWKELYGANPEYSFDDRSFVARTWIVVLSYLLTDYRYLHH